MDKTLLQQLYKKQISRLRRAYNQAIKEGYQFDKTFEEIVKPVKRVSSKTIERLKEIKPAQIRRKSKEYIDTSTGEVLNPKKQEKLIRKSVQQKKKEQQFTKQKRAEYEERKRTTPPPSFSDIIISNFRATLNSFPRAEGAKTLIMWLDRLILDNGKDAVAKMLQDGIENGLIITREIVYSSEKTFNYMYTMMNYLQDQGEIYRDDIMEMMEQMESAESWEQPS